MKIKYNLLLKGYKLNYTSNTLKKQDIIIEN